MSDKAVRFEPSGDIAMHIGGEWRTLRYPLYGIYLQIKKAWIALTDLDGERVEIGKRLQDLDSPDRLADVVLLDKLTDELNAGKAELWNSAFKHLADAPLPEDFKGWPTWVLTDDTLVNQVLSHWQAVPLVPGE